MSLIENPSGSASADHSASPLARLLSVPISNKLFLIAPACVAVIGFAIHASLMNKPNFAGVVYPQSRSCLLTISLLYFCLEGLLLQFRFEAAYICPARLLPRSYFSSPSLIRNRLQLRQSFAHPQSHPPCNPRCRRAVQPRIRALIPRERHRPAR